MKFRQHHIKRQLKEEKFQSAVPENQQLVNRMANLAQANHVLAKPNKTRKRNVIALISSFGLVGWLFSGIASASVLVGTLAATDSLPDPIQKITSQVLEVVGIDVPNPDKQQKRVETDNIEENEESPVPAPPSVVGKPCLLYTSPSPRDQRGSRMPSSA